MTKTAGRWTRQRDPRSLSPSRRRGIGLPSPLARMLLSTILGLGGAGAVIAPLTKIPQVLAPLFSEIFYRALRFLPAEKALQRTLAVLRAHGDVLAARDPAMKKALEEHGSMDVFEYRYMGATGLSLGGRVSRWVGRLSFWWWERALRRISVSDSGPRKKP